MYKEHQFVVPITDIRGTIPPEIYGAFYRNGPGKNEVGGSKNGHWFDGDGMISAFYFKNGQVTVKNAYVKTPAFMEEQLTGKREYQTFGSRLEGGIPKNFLAALFKRKNPANTNVVFHAGKLLALHDVGLPFSLNPLTLETFEEETFQGQLGKYGSICAHPRLHRQTGKLYAVGHKGKDFKSFFELAIFEIDDDGTLREVVTLPKDKRRTSVHDILLIDNHLVLTMLPFYPKHILSLLTGTKSISDTMKYIRSEKHTVYLIDLKSKTYKSFEASAHDFFHYVNGYRLGRDFIYYIFESQELREATSGLLENEARAGVSCRLQRVTIKDETLIEQEYIDHLSAELPVINSRYHGIKNEYFYSCEQNIERSVFSSVLLKSSYQGDSQKYDFGKNQIISEPSFVPRKGAEAEDDGWLLCSVYDKDTHRSYLSVIDARSFTQEVARVQLPYHLPLGFHGTFVAGECIPNFDEHDQLDS